MCASRLAREFAEPAIDPCKHEKAGAGEHEVRRNSGPRQDGIGELREPEKLRGLRRRDAPEPQGVGDRKWSAIRQTSARSRSDRQALRRRSWRTRRPAIRPRPCSPGRKASAAAPHSSSIGRRQRHAPRRSPRRGFAAEPATCGRQHAKAGTPGRAAARPWSHRFVKETRRPLRLRSRPMRILFR